MFLYPWGDMHSINLGWFLLQFKEWVEKIQEYLDNGGGTAENLANVIAPVFNAANSYLTGDYVMYNDELYKANEAISPGTWDPDKWTRCLAMEEISSGASIDNVARLMIAGNYSAYYGYQKYAICRYNDKLWMCNTNLPSGGEEWTPTHWDEITVGAGLTGLRRSVETLSDHDSTLNVTSISDLSTSINRFITFGTAINMAGITFPQYAKGILVSQGGTDASLYAISLEGKLYTAFRNNGTWVNGKCINNEISDLNSAINSVENGLAIIANGNVHYAIESGKYVYIKNHSTLANGLYKANVTIPTNNPITSTDVTLASGLNGALNDLQNTSGTQYCKFADGTALAWGVVTGLTFTNENIKEGTLALPFTFTSAYAFTSPFNTSNPTYMLWCGASIPNMTTLAWTLATLNGSPISIDNRGFVWLVVGRWK